MPATAQVLPATDDRRTTEAELINADGRIISEADYWACYYELPDTHYEWNNDCLEEKRVSDNLTCWTYNWLVFLLNERLKVHPIAKCTGLKHGFRIALRGRIVIRKPDLAVVRNDNPIRLGELDCSYRGVFDPCIQALSDNDRAAQSATRWESAAT